MRQQSFLRLFQSPELSNQRQNAIKLEGMVLVYKRDADKLQSN